MDSCSVWAENLKMKTYYIGSYLSHWFMRYPNNGFPILVDFSSIFCFRCLNAYNLPAEIPQKIKSFEGYY